MGIQIENEFGYDKDYDYLYEVVDETLKEEQVKNAIFSIIFVSLERIREINRTYRNIDKVTDVISFALEDNDTFVNPEVRFLGEIYICIPRMEEQAKEYGHSCKRELSFLTVHGLLHLLGYDHMVLEEEKIMFAKQDKILDRLHITR